MKRVWIGILAMIVSMAGFAQELKVSSFEMLADDESAKAGDVRDLNGNACAFVLIESPCEIDRVEGNVLGKVEKNAGFWRVNMTDGSRMMRLIPRNYLPKMITFADYGVKSLRGGCTYRLRIKVPDETMLKTEAAVQEEPEEEYHGNSIETFRVNGVAFNMIRVAGGTFMMGAGEEHEGLSEKNELPVHQVKLSSYWMGETEVTQELWKAVMGKNPSTHKGNKLPVEHFSWDDCQKFISKLNALTGREFRLPTEAEWEFAARGGRKSQGYVFSGSDNIKDVGWYNDLSHSGGYKWDTHAVKQKQCNELGFYDMTGNVRELCSDWLGDYSADMQVNPQGAEKGTQRVARGGSSDNMESWCRVTYRGFFWGAGTINYRSYDGLRLVLSSKE